MRVLRPATHAISLAFLILVSACGGGGGGGSSTPPPPPPPAAPTGLSYPTPPDLVTGVAITALTPTVTGSVTTYSVTPALPAGLTLNTTSGQISGTPTAATASTNYQVTASNAGGSSSYTFAMAVYFRLQVAYQSNYTFVTGVPVQNATPTVSNGTVSSWSITPALPAGLDFSTTTGTISGTPTAVSSDRNYSVTAHGVGGDAPGAFRIAVMGGSANDAQVLVDLGHVSGIREVEIEGERLQSRDLDNKVVLWNLQTGASLRSTYSDCPADTAPAPDCSADSDMAGPVLAVRVRAGWDIFATADGAYVTRIADETGFDWRWSLSTDGSYLLARGASGLKAYSTANGTTLLTRAGDYLIAAIFADAGEIRAGNAPSGAQTLERITVPGGVLTTTALVGTFYGWFADGEKFFTTSGSTARVYSREGTQLDIAALPAIRRLRGRGNWYWIIRDDNMVDIHAVGSAGVVAASVASNDPNDDPSSGPEMFLTAETSTTRTARIVDLSGTVPVVQNFTPLVSNTYGFASSSATRRAFAGSDGVVWTEINGVKRVLSQGRARSLAASTTRVAIATAAGQILIHDAQTGAHLDTIDRRSSKVVLSADGALLAVGPNLADDQYDTDRTTRVYSLPSKTLVHDWPETYTAQGPAPFDVTLSPLGDHIGISVRDSFIPLNVTLTSYAMDGTVVWTNTRTLPTFNTQNAGMRINFSPDGTRHAVADGAANEFRTGTNIYLGATLSGAATGWPVGWIDDGHLLINRYSGTTYDTFTGVEVVDSAGAVLTSPALPQMWRFEVAGPHSVYSPEYNRIYDTETGAVTWSSEAPSGQLSLIGAVAPGKVFFGSGSTIRVEPR